MDWRATTTEAWEKFELVRGPGNFYNPRVTNIAEEAYQRMIKPFKGHPTLDIPETVSVEFEAWVVLVLLTTWKSPSTPHTERNCWGMAWIRSCNLVEQQRENQFNNE